MTIRERLAECDPDFLFAEGYDECIIGVALRAGQPDIIAYNIDAIIEELVKQGMTTEEAIEFFEFNIVGAYVGERTPIFINTNFL